jgi:hypothetical protein
MNEHRKKPPTTKSLATKIISIITLLTTWSQFGMNEYQHQVSKETMKYVCTSQNIL